MDSTQDATADAHNVERMQQSLNALGYRADDGRELATDGEFGPRTRSAAMKFQNERMPDAPTDGMIGPRTMMALARYADYLNDLEDSRHPCHAMYGRAVDGVSRLPPPCPHDGAERAKLAAALTHAAQGAGMSNIDHVIPSEDGKRVFAVEGELDSPLKKIIEVDVQKSASTPLNVSKEAMADHALAAAPAAAPDVGLPPRSHTLSH